MQAKRPKEISPRQLLRRQVGMRLRQARVALGFETAAEAAKAVGVPLNTYTNWERGERFPSEELIIELGRLGASLDYIFLGLGHPITGAASKGTQQQPREAKRA